MVSLRFLIVNCYAPEGRSLAQSADITAPETLFRDLLSSFLRDPFESDVLYIVDGDASLPAGADLASYDGIIWSGSSLTIYSGEARVTKQIEFARDVYRAGVPSYGSCWGLQIAASAAGGVCRKNPSGQEVGLARSIRLTDAGRGHPMFAGKPAVFDCPAIHHDEVEVLPPAGVLLASNGISQVQAAAIEHLGTPFWAVQYHPEFDLGEMARLFHYRAAQLIESGYADAPDQIEAVSDDWAALHKDPNRKDLAWRYGIDLSMIDPDVRFQEIRNFVRYLVMPRAALRVG